MSSLGPPHLRTLQAIDGAHQLEDEIYGRVGCEQKLGLELRRERTMPLRMLKIADVTPFAYAYEGNIKAGMADIGRRIGSKTIGLAIQTVAPGCLSSRPHKHVFQEEILIVMSGTGLLHHAAERFAVGPGDCVCYLPEDPEPHALTPDHLIW